MDQIRDEQNDKKMSASEQNELRYELMEEIINNTLTKECCEKLGMEWNYSNVEHVILPV